MDTAQIAPLTTSYRWLRGLAMCAAVATLLLLISMAVLGRVELNGGGHFDYSREYLRLSTRPYSESPIQSRSLVPWFAQMVGLSGTSYIFFSALISLTLLVLCYAYFAKHTGNLVVGVLGAFLIATLPLFEFSLYAPGWPDHFCYSLLLLTLLFPRCHPFLGIFGMLAHEFYAIFLLYFLLFGEGTAKRRCVEFAIILLSLAVLRYLFNFPAEGNVGPSMLVSQFLQSPLKNLTEQPLIAGFLSGFKVFIVLVPLAIWSSRLSVTTLTDNLRIIVPILLLVPALAAAHDSTRIWSLALPSFIISIRKLSDYRGLLLVACVANYLLPSYGFSKAWKVSLTRETSIIELLYRALTQSISW